MFAVAHLHPSPRVPGIAGPSARVVRVAGLVLQAYPAFAGPVLLACPASPCLPLACPALHDLPARGRRLAMNVMLEIVADCRMTRYLERDHVGEDVS